MPGSQPDGGTPGREARWPGLGVGPQGLGPHFQRLPPIQKPCAPRGPSTSAAKPVLALCWAQVAHCPRHPEEIKGPRMATGLARGHAGAALPDSYRVPLVYCGLWSLSGTVSSCCTGAGILQTAVSKGTWGHPGITGAGQVGRELPGTRPAWPPGAAGGRGRGHQLRPGWGQGGPARHRGC